MNIIQVMSMRTLRSFCIPVHEVCDFDHIFDVGQLITEAWGPQTSTVPGQGLPLTQNSAWELWLTLQVQCQIARHAAISNL